MIGLWILEPKTIAKGCDRTTQCTLIYGNFPQYWEVREVREVAILPTIWEVWEVTSHRLPTIGSMVHRSVYVWGWEEPIGAIPPTHTHASA